MNDNTIKSRLLRPSFLCREISHCLSIIIVHIAPFIWSVELVSVAIHNKDIDRFVVVSLSHDIITISSEYWNIAMNDTDHIHVWFRADFVRFHRLLCIYTVLLTVIKHTKLKSIASGFIHARWK